MGPARGKPTLERPPFMPRHLPSGPGHSGLPAASSCLPLPPSPAADGAGEGEIRGHGSRVEGRPGEGLRAFREAGKGRRRPAATCLAPRHVPQMLDERTGERPGRPAGGFPSAQRRLEGFRVTPGCRVPVDTPAGSLAGAHGVGAVGGEGPGRTPRGRLQPGNGGRRRERRFRVCPGRPPPALPLSSDKKNLFSRGFEGRLDRSPFSNDTQNQASCRVHKC